MATKTKTRAKQRVTTVQLPIPRKKTESVIVTLEPAETTRLNHRLAIAKATRRALADRTEGLTPRDAYGVQRDIVRRVDALAYAHAELASFVDRFTLPLSKKELALVTAVGKALEKFSGLVGGARLSSAKRTSHSKRRSAIAPTTSCSPSSWR